MANIILSPNMNLPVPTVSVDPGPDWANNINSCLSILDQHNHAAGSGIQITQAGINLTSASASADSLNFNITNAYNLRSVRFSAQSAALALATDIGCIYESGVDLYYNDGSGNQIRLTQSGSIVGTAGSIGGLPSGTASASYGSGTFVFQSATSTSANIDAGSYIVRQNIASANGITISSPNSLAANYSLILPTGLPVALAVLTCDTSGNVSYLSPSATLTIGTLNVGTIQTTGTITIGTGGPTLSKSPNARLVSDGGLFFPGGIASASIEPGPGTKTLGVRTSDGAGGASGVYLPIMVSAIAATNGLQIVRGTVHDNGSSTVIDAGEGFTVTRVSSSSCTVTFTNAFLDTPVIIGSSNTGNTVTAGAISSSSFLLGFTIATSGSFVAIGQRGA